ncbi:MAG: hypothetical protein QM658_14195 [Gordonia sp. (in: high G+C Gram-positive bacteria)]
MPLDVATKVALASAGLIFLWALVLGVWKYLQITRSDDGHAHVYVDIAHRAALMYSFAAAMLGAFVQFSAWPSWLNVTSVAVVVFFFVTAIASYAMHGARRDTTNQMHPPTPSMAVSMGALILGEVGGSAIIVAGFLVELC